MARRVPGKPAGGLLELPLAADSVAALRLVPRDRHVHEPLEEIALVGRRRAPRQLELLVRGEELAAADQLEALSEVRPSPRRLRSARRTCPALSRDRTRSARSERRTASRAMGR